MFNKLKVRAVRGAASIEENSSEAIQNATGELLKEILTQNKISSDDIISAVFTVTEDIDAEFPAKTARIQFGWNDTPMVCAREIPVQGSLEKCIRVMILFYTKLGKKEISHVYQGRAKALRPDLQENIDLNIWQINAIKEGIKTAENGELYSTEEVLAHLEKSGEK
jgi:chorismate mutase